MKSVVNTLLVVSLLLSAVTMCAQEQKEEPDENRKSNGHLGLPISAPVNPMGQIARPGTGVIYGAGFNFTRRHAVIGEFMWDWLHPRVSGFTGTPNVDGHSNLYALTANYRFELRSKTLGTYFIAGGAGIFAIQA